MSTDAANWQVIEAMSGSTPKKESVYHPYPGGLRAKIVKYTCDKAVVQKYSLDLGYTLSKVMVRN